MVTQAAKVNVCSDECFSGLQTGHICQKALCRVQCEHGHPAISLLLWLAPAPSCVEDARTDIGPPAVGALVLSIESWAIAKSATHMDASSDPDDQETPNDTGWPTTTRTISWPFLCCYIRRFEKRTSEMPASRHWEVVNTRSASVTNVVGLTPELLPTR